MNSNKKILIKKFLHTFYRNLEYSPKRMMYFKNGKVYFEYNLKEEIIFLNWQLMVYPVIRTLNLNADDPVILTEIYKVMEEWFEEEYKIVGSIT
jgi:hypothetical protein